MKSKLLLLSTIFCGTALLGQTFTAMTGILNGTTSSGEPCVLDMNGDHLDDVVRFGNGNLIIDYQQPDGTFVLETHPASIVNYPNWSVAGGDIDGNGFNDLILGNGSAVSFVYANATGTGYNEVLVPENIFSQRTNMVDIDNDGNLDAFACHDVDESHPYRNDGAGNLIEDQSLITTVPVGGNYASIWTDFDNDGDLDLYMSKCRSGAAPSDPQRINGMYQNNGDGSFTEMAASINMADNDQSWVTIFEDFDNDGDFDTYTVNHANANRLMENDGSGYYTEVTAGSGIDASDLDSWACIGADFDNDGYVDILTQSFVNKEFYHNDGGLQFTSSSLPFNDGSLCDLNNDGFIDVYTGGALYMNDGNDNHYVKFSLEGITSNLNGIGARIEIFGDWGMQTRESRAGESFAPMSTLDIHFGLGTSTEIDSTLIHWPSGLTTSYYGLEIDQLHVLPEAECTFVADPINTSGPTQFCPGESVILTAPSGYNYLWNDDSNTQAITATESGSYSVQMSDADGCLSISQSVIVEVIQDESPEISLSNSPVFCAGSAIVLTSSEALGYTWSSSENSQSITVTESGTYSVTANGQCSDLSSETVEITVLHPSNPSVTDLEVNAAGEYDVSAIGDNITWYDSAAGSNAVGQGNSYSADVPAGGITLYASSSEIAIGESLAGAKLDNTGGGGLPSTGAYSYFDVWEAFTLDQVTVYDGGAGAGDRTFQLVDGDDIVLISETFSIVEGENVIALGWDIPTGEGMSLRCLENNLFRNSSGVTYPYAIGELGEVYDSFYGSQYYYYFYNWQVTTGAVTCESELVPLVISVVTGVEELEAVTTIDTYPNPADDQLVIDIELSSTANLNIKLIDVLGAVVAQQEVDHQGSGLLKVTMDIRHLAAGTYELQLSDTHASLSRPIVKR